MPLPDLTSPTHDRSDAELMSAYQNGRQDAALVALVQRYEVQLFGRCLQLMRGNRASALDLYQETVLRVVEQLQKGEKINYFPRYLYQVSGGKAIDHFRKQERAATYARELAIELETNTKAFQDTPDFFTHLEQEALNKQLINQAIAQLSGLQAVAIRKFFLEGASYREIAEQSGEEISRVKSALQNGKRKLNKWLTNNFKQQ